MVLTPMRDGKVVCLDQDYCQQFDSISAVARAGCIADALHCRLVDNVQKDLDE
jgi:hypothetical protein